MKPFITKKPYKVHVEYRKKKTITVVAESADEAAKAILESSDDYITISELEVEVDAWGFTEDEEE